MGEEKRRGFIPKHGGYRKLKSFQVAQLAFDVTVRFVDKYIDRFSRTRDQMVQAARSGVQNIAEASQASGTSKETEIKLTNVARASLEELKLYPEFSANAALVLVNVACALLSRQLHTLEQDFLEAGGLRERMTRARLNVRDDQKRENR
jgi:four helix bundle suffix protein